MYSELFRIPLQLGGTPLFGFGLLLLAWLVGAGLLIWNLRRKGVARAELWGYAPVVAIGALALIFLPRAFPEGLPIRGYGLMLLTGASSGLWLAIHRAEQNGLSGDVIFSMAFWLFLFGIAGARLFFVIEYWEVAFAGNGFWNGLRKALMFTEGGLVVYGSLIGASAAFFVFCHRKRLPPLAMADILAPSLVVGLAIGRLGCLLNGCCYGGPCDRPWAITFPRMSSPDRLSPAYEDQVMRGQMHGVQLGIDPHEGSPRVVVEKVSIKPPLAGLEPGAVVTAIEGHAASSRWEVGEIFSQAYSTSAPVHLRLKSGETVTLPAAEIRERSLPVHPTQIYSTMNAGLLAWFLWTYYPFRRKDGEVIALLMTIYPVTRFLLEHIRTDESATFGTGLSISQNVSIVILAGVALFWLWLFNRKGKLAFSR